MRVLVYGNANADISVKPVTTLNPDIDTTFVETIGLSNGGNGMTAAMILRRLGVECSLATYMGDSNDFFSCFLAGRLRDEGVDTSLIRWIPGETSGIVIVLISEQGKRFFLYKKGVQDKMKLDQDVLDQVEQYDVVSIHGTYLMPQFDGAGTERLLRTAKEQGKTTLMDVTPDVAGKWMETIKGAIPYCDYFAPSILEARSLTGKTHVSEMAEVLLHAGARNVIIKMGDEGAFYTNGQDEGIVPAFEVPVVDTTGAGDCFCAGMISTLKEEMPLRERVRFANAAAAVSCTSLGAATGIESMEQVKKLLKTASHPVPPGGTA